MFTKLCVENFEGILNRIEFDFIARSRKKDEQISLYKTHDGIYINKLVGILAGNASGKTTVIDALGTLGSLMLRPIMRFDYKEQKKKINDLLKNMKYDKDVMEQMLEKIKNSVIVEFQNVSKPNEDTYIEVEMYIEDGDLTGYYNYKLQINGKSKKIIKEQFSYRKNYKDNQEDILNLQDTTECQLYYINRYHDNMIDLEMINKEKLEYKYKFINVFFNHYIKNSEIIGIDIPDFIEDMSFIKFYKNNSKLMESIIKIIDPKIDKIKMKPDNDEEELIYELKTGGNITRESLSKGTTRFLNLVLNAIKVINKRGVLLIDEIELNMHKELIFLILRLFVQLDDNSTQIIFTTNLPEIFDCLNGEEKKLFKQDAIYLLNNINGNVEAKKMSEIWINNRRIKGDALVSTIYKRGDISAQPNKEEIDNFLKSI